MALIHQPLEPSTSRRSPKAMLLVTWSPANDIFYEPSEHPSTTLWSTRANSTLSTFETTIVSDLTNDSRQISDSSRHNGGECTVKAAFSA
ncbi:uncharacterized protein LOC102610417 isoform X3 [Citrus sinensis]|uniref:uncharacterized protein LOC102610417 isoform X3 n=1 Tax=Citrus sinensis TaxID=2711 RepID=UPI002277599B|nr:uncharacterized protein LOC102610417 isoform X3 [Citrus sinensis]